MFSINKDQRPKNKEKLSMRKYLYILLILVSVSCDDALFNSGDIITKNIEIEKFSKIYIEDIFEIYLIQDSVCRIEAKGGSNLIPNLEFSVDEDKILTIKDNNSANWSRNYDKIELYISVDTLRYMRLNAPSKVVTQNTLITPELVLLSIDDYAEYDININCNNCYIVNSETSGGKINLTGETNSFTFWARGSFEVNAENFIANYVTVKHESLADCKIHVTKELSVEILRDGNLYYKGDPETITYVNDRARDQLIKIE